MRHNAINANQTVNVKVEQTLVLIKDFGDLRFYLRTFMPALTTKHACNHNHLIPLEVEPILNVLQAIQDRFALVAFQPKMYLTLDQLSLSVTNANHSEFKFSKLLES